MISINKFKKIIENKNIIIGVSGGPDSVCLLYLFNNLKKDWNLKLSVCHINYGLRGADSDKDEKIVCQICQEKKIKCYILNCRDRFKNINKNENSLRDIRYNFFKEIKEKINADYIAVAHNIDDQAETILMKFIRGASLRGLGGMNFLSGFIIRPLLGFNRREILEFLEKNKINYRIDKTNLEENYLRNKIRNNLIPLLEKEYNPNFKNTIVRNSEILRNANIFIQEYSNLILKNISKINENLIEIDYKKWLLLPVALKFETIRISIEKLLGNIQDIDYTHLNEIIGMLTNRIPFGKKEIIKNLSIKEKYAKIVVECKK